MAFPPQIPHASNPQKAATRSTATNRIMAISPEDALSVNSRGASYHFSATYKPSTNLWKSRKILRRGVDFPSHPPYTCKVVWTPLCWTGGFRSLTTDTMCQNLFETIQVFERGWSE